MRWRNFSKCTVAGPDLAGGGPGARAPCPPPLNLVWVSGPESHRVNYALQYITGTIRVISVFSIGLQELLN